MRGFQDLFHLENEIFNLFFASLIYEIKVSLKLKFINLILVIFLLESAQKDIQSSFFCCFNLYCFYFQFSQTHSIVNPLSRSLK